MRKKIVNTMVAMAVAGCLALTGCGNSDASYSENKTDSNYGASENAVSDYGFDSYEQAKGAESVQADDTAMYEEEADSVGASAESNGGNEEADISKQVAASGKKIIKTYRYSYDTEKFEEAYQYLREQVSAHNGYISSSEMYGTDLRQLSLTARIPVDQCDAFVSQLGSLGTVVSQSESAEDVTLQYNDTESRITSLKTEQQRINELLKEADSLETIIALEERLTDVRYELENYQSQKNLYDDLIAYCTVNISLSEVSYEVPVDDSTVFSRMKSGFITSLRDIGHGLINFIVWLVAAAPYLIIWGLVIFVIYRIIRKMIRKSKAKKQAKWQAMMAEREQQMMQPVSPQYEPADHNEGQQDTKSVQK